VLAKLNVIALEPERRVFNTHAAEAVHMKRTIETPDAPAAVGAYSQATTDGDILFTAGQIPLTPDGELLDDEPIATQTRQSLENVKAILEAEGLTMQDVLKVSVYLDDIDDFDEMNDAYKEYFQDNPPARSAIEVGSLPKGAGVEIEAIAAQRD
jgi:2-iminobutanoate/2-iminopropanoate deaminase